MKMSGTSRRPNVAMLGQLLCRSTSSNVATSQRRDVSTSRCCNVATLQRRDVSASSAYSSLKEKRGADFEVSGIIRTRARKSEQQ